MSRLFSEQYKLKLIEFDPNSTGGPHKNDGLHINNVFITNYWDYAVFLRTNQVVSVNHILINDNGNGIRFSSSSRNITVTSCTLTNINRGAAYAAIDSNNAYNTVISK